MKKRRVGRFISIIMTVLLLSEASFGSMPAVMAAPGEDTVSDAPSADASTGEMYSVDGVKGGRVQFDKESGTITWLESSVTEAVIPETIDGVTVTALGDWATPWESQLTKLVLPDSVTSVGQGFGQYSHITEFSFPAKLTSLPDYSFRYCDTLESITVPGEIKTLGQCCFMGCSALKSVTLESGVTTIGQNSFQSCSELTTLSMPATLKKIDNYAFRYCELLEFVSYDGEDFYPFDGAWDKTLKIGDYCFQTALFGHPDFSDSYKKGSWYQALHEVKPSGNYLTDLFAVAESQLGYHEGSSINDMSGSSSGYGDYAEYCYWWNEPGEMWCGEFVGWCFAMAGVPLEVVEPKYQTKDAEGETRRFAWSETSYAGGSYALKKGDVILFKYTGGNHIILVESVSQSGNTVTVNAINGNHSNDVSKDTYTINASTGNTINEWSSKDGYVDTIYSPDFSIADGLSKYTVNFDMQGGSASWNSKTLTNNASYGVMPLPTRNGYTFDGWYTQAAGGTKITSYRRARLSGNITLYAHWKEASGETEEPEDPGEEIDTSKWKIDSDGTITYIPYDWRGGRIPTEIKGVKVTAIGDWAAYDRTAITKLTIPGCVITVGRGAFYDCENLLSVTMEEGVKKLGNTAFFSCDRLASVSIPASMEQIGEDAGGKYTGEVFYDCGQLSDVTFAGNRGEISYGWNTFGGTLYLRADFSTPYRSSEYYEKLMAVEPNGDYLADTIAVAASQDGYHEGNSFEEMDGSNINGNDDYAEMAYFAGYPTERWWSYDTANSYGGWCRNYCEWSMAMASMPQEIHSLWTRGSGAYHTWAETKYAEGNGTYEIKSGDVLRLSIGHHCLVTAVRTDGNTIEIDTWNGNDKNNVAFYTTTFRASDGYNLTMYEKYGGNYGERLGIERIYPYLPGKLSSVKFYTVSFEGNGGTVPAGREKKQLAASAYYGIMPVPVREGYRFDGWYTESTGGTKITSYRKSALTEDIKLYAHWTAQTVQESSGSGMDPVPAIKKAGSEWSVWLVKGQNVEIGAGTWSTKDKKIATVNNAGRVTAKGQGQTTVSGKTKDGTETNLNVTVAAPRISQTSLKLLVGSSSEALSLDFGKADASKYPVSWCSSKEAVATVDASGVVTALAKGSAVIYAYCGGKTYSCKLAVTDQFALFNPKAAAYGVEISMNPLSIISPKYRKADGSLFKVKNAIWGWSDDPEADFTEAQDMDEIAGKKGITAAYTNGVVEINASNGKIRAVGPGTVKIFGVENVASPTVENITCLIVTVTPVPAQKTAYVAAGKSLTLRYLNVKNTLASWSLSGDSDCAALEEKKEKYTGKLKTVAGKSGKVDVSCSYKGFSWTTTVYVEDPSLATGDGITAVKGLNYSLSGLTIGNERELKLSGAYQKPVFKSSKNSVVFVDEKGKLYARGKGKAVITVKIGSKSLKLNVEVK